MKRRSLFKSIAAVAGFNLLARNFSVTESLKPIDINAPNACLQLDDLFKGIKFDPPIIKRVADNQPNPYWGRIN